MPVYSGALHSALDLHAGNAGVLDLTQAVNKAIVLERERMAVLKSAAHGVFHAAGLGAHAAIAAAAAYKRRHVALPRMAEAQRSVDEYLRFYRRMLCYELYLLETQLARKDCTGKSHLGGRLDAGKVMDAHLGARVQRNIRHGLSQYAQEPEILHKDGVRAEIRYAPGKLDGLLHLPVADERVHRDIDLAVAYAAVSDRLFQTPRR